jgi:hypothetical protein
MIKQYQRGGSVIHDVNTGLGVPNVSYAPTLDLPEVSLTPLTSALNTYTKIQEQDRKVAQDNMAGLATAYDAITKVRYDNVKQQQAIEEAKQRAGISEDMFNMSVEQLKNPYTMGNVSKATSAFASDRGIRNVIREQAVFDATLADYTKSPPTDPNLQKMFFDQVRAYQNGETTGLEINADVYRDLDITADLMERFSKVPQVSTSELIQNNTVSYEEQIQKRSEEALNSIMAERLKDPKFRNNMIAKGYIDAQTGELTEEGQTYTQDIIGAYNQETKQIVGLKNLPNQKTGLNSVGLRIDADGGTPASRRGLKDTKAALFDNFFIYGTHLGVDLEAPESTALVGHILSQLKNAEGDNANSGASEEVVKNVQGLIEKEAWKRGNRLQALYTAAANAEPVAYTGTYEDFVGLVAARDGDAFTTGQFETTTSYAPMRSALAELVGEDEASIKQGWNEIHALAKTVASGPAPQQAAVPGAQAAAQSAAAKPTLSALMSGETVVAAPETETVTPGGTSYGTEVVPSVSKLSEEAAKYAGSDALGKKTAANIEAGAKKSVGACGRGVKSYVGAMTGLDWFTKDQPLGANANGFSTKGSNDFTASKGYNPKQALPANYMTDPTQWQVGDIVASGGGTNGLGHMQTWTGDAWVSDFDQGARVLDKNAAGKPYTDHALHRMNNTGKATMQNKWKIEAGYDRAASTIKKHLDTAFMDSVEGDKTTFKGYVPSNKKGTAIGNSGVTIGGGVDLGGQGVAELQAAGIPPYLIEKFKPYLGLRTAAAKAKLKKQPLTITAAEAKFVTASMQLANLRGVKKLVDGYGINYNALPKSIKTVLLSQYYQRGSGGFPSMYGEVLRSQNWKKFSELLKKHSQGDRGAKEAALLAKGLKELNIS